MPLGSILATVAAYVAIAVLLLSLNLTSRWRWWIKGGAIVVTGLFFIGSYVAISSLLGWPTQKRIPDRFLLVATRVVEPDPFTGNPGAVFLWLEQMDENNVPNGRPRSFKLSYTEELAARTDEAQERLNEGEEVQGAVEEAEDAAGEDRAEGEPAEGERTGGAAYPAIEFNLVFDNLAPVALPDKGVL